MAQDGVHPASATAASRSASLLTGTRSTDPRRGAPCLGGHTREGVAAGPLPERSRRARHRRRRPERPDPLRSSAIASPALRGTRPSRRARTDHRRLRLAADALPQPNVIRRRAGRSISGATCPVRRAPRHAGLGHRHDGLGQAVLGELGELGLVGRALNTPSSIVCAVPTDVVTGPADLVPAGGEAAPADRHPPVAELGDVLGRLRLAAPPSTIGGGRWPAWATPRFCSIVDVLTVVGRFVLGPQRLHRQGSVIGSPDDPRSGCRAGPSPGSSFVADPEDHRRPPDRPSTLATSLAGIGSLGDQVSRGWPDRRRRRCAGLERGRTGRRCGRSSRAAGGHPAGHRERRLVGMCECREPIDLVRALRRWVANSTGFTVSAVGNRAAAIFMASSL